MLALLQRLISLSLLLAAVSWLLCFFPAAPVLAMVGFFAIAFGHSVFLAFEFMLLRRVNRGDPVPQPSKRELLKAWLGETLTTPKIFYWWQPFRANAVPDQLLLPDGAHTRRGVVFIHGLFCNRGFWTPWLKQLQHTGHPFVAVNLEPIFGAIESYVPQIEDAVQRVTQATGYPPLLVCHSMGGLVARAWLKEKQAEARVYHVVTIGTPHCGTWLARFGRGINSQQMRLSSDWQAQLSHGIPIDRHALFTCWYSNCDNIVFPSSAATLPGADNRLVRGIPHVKLAFVPQVMQATLALLDDTPV